MGRRDYTNFAIFNGEKITSARASRLVEEGIKIKDCTCIDCGKSMKFVPCKNKDNYFAHVVKNGEKIQCTSSGNEGYLHEHAKNLLADVSIYDDCRYNGFFIRDDLKLYLIDILSVELEKRVELEGGTIIPDVTLSTSKGVVYVEIIDTHPLSQKTQSLYRKLYKDNKNMTVVQVYIDDISKLAKKEDDYYKVEHLLLDRLFGESDKKVLLNLYSRCNKKAPFGKCYNCNTPYTLVANKEDRNTNGNVINMSGIKAVNLIEYSRFKEADRTSLGSAILHCPHCKEEGIFIPIFCPACLKRGRGYVPMKFLRNSKTGKVFLACNNYRSVEETRDTGEKSECNCTLTIFESNGKILADEVQSLSSFNAWLRGSEREFKYVEEVRHKES